MKTLVLYYSLAGSTAQAAEALAREEGADLCRVFEKKRRSLFTAFLPGCSQAMRRHPSKIIRPETSLEGYDRILIGAPIWAGFPAPAWNAMLALLPRGREVGLFFCSAGGEEPKSEAGNRTAVEAAGCHLIFYRDIATGKTPSVEKPSP